MTSSDTLSVNFGNMEQLLAELTSIVNQVGQTKDDMVSRLSSVLGPDDNWGGGGKQAWQSLQNQWNQTMEHMHQVLTAAQKVTAESNQVWPVVDAGIAALFSG